MFVPGDGDNIVYYPRLIAAADIVYDNARYKVEAEREAVFTVEIEDGPVTVDWDNSELTDVSVDMLADDGVDNADFADCPAAALTAMLLNRFRLSPPLKCSSLYDGAGWIGKIEFEQALIHALKELRKFQNGPNQRGFNPGMRGQFFGRRNLGGFIGFLFSGFIFSATAEHPGYQK